MKRKFKIFSVLTMISLFLVIGFIPNTMFAIAADSEDTGDNPNFKYHEVTTAEGLTFRVPEDMPIEKRNGILAPIPFDEYMYGKFKQMDERLKEIQAQLDRIEEAQRRQETDKPKTLKG